MTFAAGVGFSLAGMAGSWESGAGMHGGLSLASSMPVSESVVSGPSACPENPSVVREFAHEPEALQLPVRADAGDACQGGW